MPPIPPPLAPSAHSTVNPQQSQRRHPPHPLNNNPPLRNPDASAQKTPPAPTRSSPRLPGSGEQTAYEGRVFEGGQQFQAQEAELGGEEGGEG